jgi:hypothetical protein
MGLDLGAGECSPPLRRLSVCIINPRYEPSYWGFDFALPLIPGGKRYSNVTGALPALAALAPPHCDVELVDENVEPIDFKALERYDVIGVTGMIVQAARMHEILHELAKLPATVVVGGAYVSVSEATFADLCDVRFIGEAEDTWPAFLTALAAGEPIAARYEQADRTDMTRCRRRDSISSRPIGISWLRCSFRAAARSCANSATSSRCSGAGRG